MLDLKVMKVLRFEHSSTCSGHSVSLEVGRGVGHAGGVGGVVVVMGAVVGRCGVCESVSACVCKIAQVPHAAFSTAGNAA